MSRTKNYHPAIFKDFPRPLMRALLCLIWLIGCTSDEPCPVLGIPPGPAIILEVWDAETNEPILAGVSGIAVVGENTIPFQTADGWGNTIWIFGPRGYYDVFVAKSGYHAWYMADVEVGGSRCVKSSAILNAELVPLASDTLGEFVPPLILDGRE